MSENNPFEILIQDKMDGFMLEPSPSDWQAIYDRLHPRNKRRIIWWWFPLFAAVGAGLIWINSGSPFIHGSDSMVKSEAAKESVKAIGSTDATSPQPVSNKNADLQSHNSKNQKSIPAITALSQSGRVIDLSSTNAKNKTVSNKRTVLNQRRSRRENTSNKKQLVGRTENDNSNVIVATSTLSVKSINENSSSVLSTSTLLKENDAEKNPVVESDNSKVKTDSPNTLSSKSTDSAIDIKAIAPEQSEVKPTAITVSNKPKKWSLTFYGGAGPNFTGDPIGLGARMKSADLPSNSSSGSSITYNNLSRENGWHLAMGIATEKKLGKKWLFMAGLGINSSTWSTHSDLYRDSIFANQLVSSTKISSVENNYRLSMLEIPLQFSNRIAGKKTGSVWWTIGMNNQFRLNLNNQNSIDSTAGARVSGSRSLNSFTRFYQPQLRIGLMYNHLGKLHWELQPLFQYSLVTVFENSSTTNPVMLNLQLQYRLFLEGKKQKSGTNK